MKKLLLILLIAFTFTNCHFIIKKMYGIKNPDIENEKTITKFARKKHMRTDNIVTVNSGNYIAALKGQGIPEAIVFDANGNYIEYKQTDTSCNAGLFQFIPQLNKTTTYNKPEHAKLETELAKFRDMKGNKLQAPAAADFYILIYWTVFTGKLNKDHVKVWEDLAYANKNANINVIKVNLDLQEYWDKAERDAIVKQIEKK